MYACSRPITRLLVGLKGFSSPPPPPSLLPSPFPLLSPNLYIPSTSPARSLSTTASKSSGNTKVDSEHRKGSQKDKEESYSQILAGLANQGDFELVTRTHQKIIDDAVSFDDVMCNNLLLAYVRLRKKEEAWTVFKTTKNSKVKINLDALTKLMRFLIEGNDKEKILTLVEWVKQEKIESDIPFFTEILGFMLKREEGLKAAEFLEHLVKRGMKFNNKIYADIIKARTTTGDVRHARKLYTQMVLDGIEIPQKVILSILQQSGVLGQAIEFLHVLRGDGVPIPKKALEVVLEHIRNTRDHNQAQHFLEFMGKQEEWLDLGLCNKVMEVFVSQRQIDKVQSFIATIHTKNLPMDTALYNTIITFFVQEDKLDTAFETIQKMVKSGIKLNSETFRPLLGKLVRQHHKEKAIELLDLVSSTGISVDNLRKHTVSLLYLSCPFCLETPFCHQRTK